MSVQSAGAGASNLPDNLVVLPGVNFVMPAAKPVDPDALMPHAFEAERIARDIRLFIDVVEKATADGVAFRSDLLPFLKQVAPQFSYKAGQIEADVLEAQGVFDVA